MNLNPKLIGIIAVVLLLLIVLIQNTHVVKLNLLFWSINTALVILIFFTVLIGFALGYILSLIKKRY